MRNALLRPALAFVFVAMTLATTASAQAQDSLWIRYDDRFTPNRRLLSLAGCDSMEFRASRTAPIVRCYTQSQARGYFDYYLTSIIAKQPGTLMFRNPGRIVYKPSEFSSMDFMDDDSKWSFKRSKESEHFIVFWEKGFGDNPQSGKVPSGLRVDIDDLLAKAERFYTTNVETLGMVETGSGRSQLDRYKMEIYLLYQTDWLATGSGYDDKVGALWVNPSTCQPVGSTIGHEIGHSFQYQTYCDNVLRGRANDHKTGFRYGLPGSNGGNGFWEQCAQWQSFQDYPDEALTIWHFAYWKANHHRHFENEWQRYASYWLHYYLTDRSGMTTIGRLWNESAYPEDALMAYTRLFCDGDYATTRHLLFDYAQRCVTFDFKAVRSKVTNQYDTYTTSLLDDGNGWLQVTYANCPAPTGFNAVPLTVPQAGTKVTARVEGLPVGSSLLASDPGIQIDGNGKSVDTVAVYNTTDMKGNEGWACGFVALKSGGERVYGDACFISATDGDGSLTGEVAFAVPENTLRLWLVVQGSPTVYRFSPWDDREATDDQLPYRLQLDGTSVK
jgi:hypothetical protein